MNSTVVEDLYMWVYHCISIDTDVCLLGLLS